MVEESNAARIARGVLKLFRDVQRCARICQWHIEGTGEIRTSASLMKNLIMSDRFFISVSLRIHSATQPVVAVLSEVTPFTLTAGLAPCCPVSNISSGWIAQYKSHSMIVNCLANSVVSKSITEILAHSFFLSATKSVLVVIGLGISPFVIGMMFTDIPG